ncbi:hypothetical protein EJ04DRAFT_573528 [Polyplosphaeria fusca]|uniref:Uncharacterized protein n=1 Tax=Polyplosphaeria fusca TaxID=682080 RepID=A0A9P4R903_9PLEO|nr:hypothetical protein EJ04DRAFT_573528 [Polyplosphaeria fusca]
MIDHKSNPKKRKVISEDFPESKKRKVSSNDASQTQQPGDQHKQDKAAKSNDKKFKNLVKKNRKYHRDQIHKARRGQEVDRNWEENRKSFIEVLREKGILKKGQEGEFAWPADVQSPSYKPKAVTRDDTKAQNAQISAKVSNTMTENGKKKGASVPFIDRKDGTVGQGVTEGVIYKGESITKLTPNTNSGETEELTLHMKFEIRRRKPAHVQ